MEVEVDEGTRRDGMEIERGKGREIGETEGGKGTIGIGRMRIVDLERYVRIADVTLGMLISRYRIVAIKAL
jgi:hypothetical protein